MVTKATILSLIFFWASVYGVRFDYATEICRLESSFDPNAVGDNGAAIGLYQWHDTSMMYVLRKMKEDGEIQHIPKYDARREVNLNIRAAMYAMGELNLDKWWSTSKEARASIWRNRRYYTRKD